MEVRRAVDLFAGMGGLSAGFALEGFEVIGYDKNPVTAKIYRVNGIGVAFVQDLMERCVKVADAPDVLLGGPPCRPWSPLNLKKRGRDHPDHPLLEVFFRHVLDLEPHAFLMENVPNVSSDPCFSVWIAVLREAGYSVDFRVVRYSDFGAASSRRRLVLAGFRNGDVQEFFCGLERLKHGEIRTVMDAIKKYLRFRKGEFPDHDWFESGVLNRYREKYSGNRYGWYRLRPDRPAPSFGNIMKTYILHPLEERVISVREAMAIMGFDDRFRFPPDTPLGTRYQMVADCVSPAFSRACARILRRML